MISFAFNDSYSLDIQVGYSRILLKVTYMSVNWAGSMRIEKAKFSRALMNFQVLFRAKMNTIERTKLCMQIYYV